MRRPRTLAIFLAASISCSGWTVANAAPAGSSAGAPAPARVLRPASDDAFAPTTDDPLRVMITGDSIMADASIGIRAALEATGVVTVERRAVFGFGLAGVYPWRTEWPQQIDEIRPDVVVIMYGGWDQDIVRLAGANVYRPILDEAISTLQRGGAQIIWIGMPSTHPVLDNEARRAVMNTMFRDLERTHPDAVTYLDPDRAWGDHVHAFAEFAPSPDGTWRRLRKVDGGHVCPEGAARMGELVREAIGRLVLLPAADAGWRGGAWSFDPQFDDPTGACPAGPPLLTSSVVVRP